MTLKDMTITTEDALFGRVLGALPSVETRALGKEAVCRVLHSAKAVFVECQILGKEGHSANVLFAECQALGKEQPSAKYLRRRRWPLRHPLPSAGR